MNLSTLVNKRVLLATITFLWLAPSAYATDWYVAPSGTDVTEGGQGTSTALPFRTIQYAQDQCEPGDRVFVMNGTYRNQGYGTGNRNNPPVVRINKSGTPDRYIVIRNLPNHQPRIEFDGAGGFIAGSSINYVKIIGFDIYGPNADITEAEALERRLDDPRLDYYNGSGIAFWGPSHHIQVRSCQVYDCPGSGIRANQADYVTFADNIVARTCWYSAAGPSAMVIAQAQPIDQNEDFKIIVERNRVYDNRNFVPIYLLNTQPGDYGGPDYSRIVDGRGIYMTRNPDYTFGKYLIRNNITYDNGFGGITFHISQNGRIINNTLYRNGADGGERQGITIAKAQNLEVFNNIVYARGKGAIHNNTFAGTSSNITLRNNLLYNGETDFEGENYVTENPQFEAPTDANFRLTTTSPAIDQSNFGTPTDFYNTERPQGGTFDLGAIEYVPASSAAGANSPNDSQLIIYPNPARSGQPVTLALDSPEEIQLEVIDFQQQTLYSVQKAGKTLSVPTHRYGPECIS